jgi:hypothetical protein
MAWYLMTGRRPRKMPDILPPPVFIFAERGENLTAICRIYHKAEHFKRGVAPL